MEVFLAELQPKLRLEADGASRSFWQFERLEQVTRDTVFVGPVLLGQNFHC